MSKKRTKHTTKRKGKGFWDKEYSDAENLSLSLNPSVDLQKFLRWLDREFDDSNAIDTVLDLGCGNGRNLIYLAKEYGVRGFGIDISTEAVEQAKKKAEGLHLEFHEQSIAEPIPTEDESYSLVLDMMTSHFLNESQRTQLLKEINRVLKPGGWYFFKTFLLDEDKHAARLLRDYPADESGSYIHPKIAVAEHVFTEQEIRDLLEDDFIIHRVRKSHKHLARGRAAKRRSISIYAQKK